MIHMPSSQRQEEIRIRLNEIRLFQNKFSALVPLTAGYTPPCHTFEDFEEFARLHKEERQLLDELFGRS